MHGARPFEDMTVVRSHPLPARDRKNHRESPICRP